MNLMPLPGYALVRLKEKYESGLSTEKEKYTERSEGTLVSFMVEYKNNEAFAVEGVAVPVAEYYNNLKGGTVYFAPYTEGEPVKHEGSEYVFLPIKELRGVKQNA